MVRTSSRREFASWKLYLIFTSVFRQSGFKQKRCVYDEKILRYYGNCTYIPATRVISEEKTSQISHIHVHSIPPPILRRNFFGVNCDVGREYLRNILSDRLLTRTHHRTSFRKKRTLCLNQIWAIDPPTFPSETDLCNTLGRVTTFIFPRVVMWRGRGQTRHP